MWTERCWHECWEEGRVDAVNVVGDDRRRTHGAAETAVRGVRDSLRHHTRVRRIRAGGGRGPGAEDGHRDDGLAAAGQREEHSGGFRILSRTVLQAVHVTEFV